MCKHKLYPYQYIYTSAGKWEAEPGAFKVFVGGNSRDVKEASFTLR